MHEHIERAAAPTPAAPSRAAARRTPTPRSERIAQTAAASGEPTTTLVDRSTTMVGAADDPLEREADRVADQVIGQLRSVAPPAPASTVSRIMRRETDHQFEQRPESSSGPATATRIHRSESAQSFDGTVSGPRIRRRVGPAPSVPAARPGRIMRRSGGDMAGSFPVPDEVGAHIASSAGGGQPLPEATGAAMGAALGADLDGVRVHTDTASAASADAIGARAYTTGSDVYFAAGEFQPESAGGQHLLAHELAHVVQQGGAGVKTLRRKRNAERHKNELVRIWSERLQGAPLNLAAGDAQTLAALAGAGPSITVLEDFAPLIAQGWAAASVAELIRRFHGENGGLGALQWNAIAMAAGAVNQTDAVVRFARVGNGWGGGNLAALIARFFVANGGHTAAEWAAIAAADPSITNLSGDAAAFAQLAGWTAVQKVALVRVFGAAIGLSRTQFLAIATAHANLANQAQHVATFVGVVGWNAAHRQALAAAWGANDGTLTPAEWRTMAEAHASLVDDEASVALFARLAGWTAANKANLVGLYAANAAGRTATQWCAIAIAHAGLADHEADVAEFARIANGWTAANLATLAGLFGANAAARPATEWAQLAGAHAGVADQETVIAGVARAAWPVVDLTNFVTQAVAAGLGAPALMTTMAIAGAPAAGRAMVVAGWTAAHLGTFVGTAQQAGLTAIQMAGFLATAQMPAATVLMRAAWGAAPLARFAAAAIGEGTTSAALRPLFATATFPARSFALIAGAWTDTHVGQFCGAALVEAIPVGQLVSLIGRVNAPIALRNMTTAGWLHDDLGTFAAAARVAGLSEALLQQLMENANFRTGTAAMRAGPWTAIQLGHFTAGIAATNLAVAQIGLLTNTPNFGANSHPWIAAGFTDIQVGELCGRARLAHGGTFLAGPLTTFLGTANAATHAAALIAAWNVSEIGTTIGFCRMQGGAPSDTQMVQLLELADDPAGVGGAVIQAAWVRSAARGQNCGAPGWASVIAQTPIFQANWLLGPVARADQGSVINPGARGGGGYSIEIELRGERIRHVEQNHTYEYHLFTYANCTRAGVGVGGHSSFMALATNVTNELVNLQGDGTVANIAENAAENAAYGTHFPTQGNTAVYRFGVLSAGGPYGAAIYPTYLSQAYPTAGTAIIGRDLVAIGRFFGQIA